LAILDLQADPSCPSEFEIDTFDRGENVDPLGRETELDDDVRLKEIVVLDAHYWMRIPEMARLMTRRWISLVPSKIV
jgi:hypothetical protein